MSRELDEDEIDASGAPHSGIRRHSPSYPVTDSADSQLPLQYEDGPDYCTVKDAQDRNFALTMQPELMKAMERALREDIAELSRPPQRWIRCSECKAEWLENGAGEVHQHTCSRVTGIAPKGDRPFYGAECPSYPSCEGGCGLGCTKEIERSGGVAQAESKPVAWQYRVMFDKGSIREDEWCDWRDAGKRYFDKVNADIAAGATRVQTRALCVASPVSSTEGK